MFSSDWHIALEILANGTMYMYSNLYDDGSTDNFSALVDSGSTTMSAKDFVGRFAGDSLTNYYSCKISNTDFTRLVSMIAGMQTDTIHYAFCCCDIPYRKVRVYFDDHYENFLECGSTKNRNIISLMNNLDTIARNKGFEKAKTRFYFDD